MTLKKRHVKIAAAAAMKMAVPTNALIDVFFTLPLL